MENGCPPAALQQILNQLQVFQDQILRLERERAAAAVTHENQIGALQQQVANLAAGLKSLTPSYNSTHIPTHNDHSALGPLNALAIANDDDPGSAPEDHGFPDHSPDPGDTEIPPIPPSVMYNSFDDLFNFLQSWARANGAAFVKKSGSNRREFNGTKIATHWLLLCDRGGSRPSRGLGHRQTSTQKTDCPVRVCASATKRNNWQWTYKSSGVHNHPRSHDPSAHSIHRRRTDGQRALASELFELGSLPAREMAAAIKERSEGPAFFRVKDIYNDRHRLRVEKQCQTPRGSRAKKGAVPVDNALATEGSSQTFLSAQQPHESIGQA